MGRGGGGGGSHHSSHSSSSHSHSGSSSYRSSGSSYSHHSSGSSYRSGSYGSGGSGGSGCSNVIGWIIFLPFIIFCVFASGLANSFGWDAIYKIDRSTIQREALPESKCNKIGEWYRDDWGDWIDESGEEGNVIKGLEYFYEKTGVQPYLWIMGEEGRDYMSEGSIEELAETTYKDMFGIDEGHVLIIFREYPNASSNYICTVTPGYDAETQVMDEEAREILLDCIDYYYTDDSLNEGMFFKTAFSQAADRIMTKQLTWNQMICIVAVVLVVVIGLVITANIIKKRKVAVAKQKAAQAQAAADKAQTEFNRQKYNDQLETQYVAVSCPNCGSTGNKIRKATVGHCPYCGTAIKVDQNGQVAILKGEGPAGT